MKKIFLTAVLAASVLTGCSDAYEIDQPGFVTEESDVFRNAGDINKGLRTVYSNLPAETEVNFTSYFTDELGVGYHNAGQGINDGSYTFLLQAGNVSAGAMWGGYYGVVNRLNRMLARVDEMMVDLKPNVPADKVIIDELNASKAHAFALRAYCHYKLFAYFTPDYTNPNGLSVIKFDFLQTDDYTRFEKRSTVAEIVSFIESDIKKAKDLGGITQTPEGTGTGYASNEMLESILIKMYSMIQSPDSYAKLELAFDRLISGDNPRGFDNAGTYASMFTSSGDGMEGIFKLDRVSTDGTVTSGIASGWYANKVAKAARDEDSSSAGGSTVYMEMGRSLYNELDKLDPAFQGQPYNENGSTPRLDARYVINVLTGSVVVPGYASLNATDYRHLDILLVGKYTGITNRPLMNNVWMFRFTDMLLSLAEKRAFEGNLTGAVAIGNYSNVESIIFNIRAHRNLDESLIPLSMPTNFSSAQQAYARILEERRLDFAFEGQRYLDMKRIGVKAGSPGFVRDAKDCETTNACSLPANSTRLTMPIPRAEMVSNPNMVQNPGY